MSLATLGSAPVKPTLCRFERLSMSVYVILVILMLMGSCVNGVMLMGSLIKNNPSSPSLRSFNFYLSSRVHDYLLRQTGNF